jgi:kinesin family protein 2/24
MKITLCIRKRPIFSKEAKNGEIDSISVSNPQIRVHEAKFKVDGITKYIENHNFRFDNSFSELEDTPDIYYNSLQPLMPSMFKHGIVTCFAYGQTGSGKTFTMVGIQN